MARIPGYLLMALLAFSLMVAPAAAGEKGMMGNPCGMMGGKGEKHMMMSKGMKKHHKMMNEVMGMMKESMVILKDFSHKPTSAQKQKLEEMISRMDEIMAKHEAMKEKCKEMKMKHEGMGEME